ncbi:hypothetical protein [Bradyrhizobium erythrophlei]|uniref:hypothetical protein n=1 Tax=Bradyrhizobium erythrophlei TaxID=1437360 RepID=UPI0012AB407D|nr:hypothetical protein [Bradyrhizobium erythrophlei]
MRTEDEWATTQNCVRKIQGDHVEDKRTVAGSSSRVERGTAGVTPDRAFDPSNWTLAARATKSR